MMLTQWLIGMSSIYGQLAAAAFEAALARPGRGDRIGGALLLFAGLIAPGERQQHG